MKPKVTTVPLRRARGTDERPIPYLSGAPLSRVRTASIRGFSWLNTTMRLAGAFTKAIIVALLLPCASGFALVQPTEAPPVLNSPVYSLATLNADGTTNMQIVTYATPVGIGPRTWAISLYRPTLTHANWLKRKSGVLQLLCEAHAPLVYALGGRSGRDDDKPAVCAASGFAWMDPPSAWGGAEAGESQEQLLSGCATYLRLVQVGELTSAGEHDVAICRVEGMLAPPDGEAGTTMADALSSARLRELGLITDRGKAVEPASKKEL